MTDKMLSIDYISLVRQDYQNKRASNSLPLSLMKPTPASIKNECLLVCGFRYDRKDERALTAFFDHGNDKEACLQAIKRFDRDKFKPLARYLNDGTGSPNFKNIELLAWLIDYKGRPWKFNPETPSENPGIMRASTAGQVEEVAEEAPSEPAVDIQEEEAPSEITPKRKTPGSRLKIIVTITIVLTGIGVYQIWTYKWSPTGPQGCMFWAGDHYKPISCNQKLDDAVVIPLDSEKLNSLKKITQPDTITENSLGHVWYEKYSGNIEFFTDSGFHPIDQRLRLLPITPYIIRKYIHHNQ